MLVFQLPTYVIGGSVLGKIFVKNGKPVGFTKKTVLTSLLVICFKASPVYAYEQIPNEFDYRPQYENFNLAAASSSHDLQTAPAPTPVPEPAPSTTSPFTTPTGYGPTNTDPFPSESQYGAQRPFADEEQEQARLKRRKIKTLVAMEIAYQVLGVLDAAQTISCMNKTNCYELNPILGRRPSTAKIVGFKLASGLLHYSAFRHYIKKEHYKSAMVFELVSLTVQGVVCGLNFRHAF